MRKFSRLAWAGAAVCALVAPLSAYADIYTYHETGQIHADQPFSATLTLDTATGVGSLVGGGPKDHFDIKFTGVSPGEFAKFMGGSSPMGMYNIDILSSSTYKFKGREYSLVPPGKGQMDMLEFLGTDINLWADWANPGCLGSTSADCLKWELTDTRGHIVPEPGMVALMGLGVMALALRRRFAMVLRRDHPVVAG